MFVGIPTNTFICQCYWWGWHPIYVKCFCLNNDALHSPLNTQMRCWIPFGDWFHDNLPSYPRQSYLPTPKNKDFEECCLNHHSPLTPSIRLALGFPRAQFVLWSLQGIPCRPCFWLDKKTHSHIVEQRTYPPWNQRSPWKSMVRRWISFWENPIFRCERLVSGYDFS